MSFAGFIGSAGQSGGLIAFSFGPCGRGRSSPPGPGAGPRHRRLHARIGAAHRQAEGRAFSRALLAGQVEPLPLLSLLRALAPGYGLVEQEGPELVAALGAQGFPWSDLATRAAGTDRSRWPQGPVPAPQSSPLQLLLKYDKPVPRYTSYPTAAQFHSGVGPADLAAQRGAPFALRACALLPPCLLVLRLHPHHLFGNHLRPAAPDPGAVPHHLGTGGRPASRTHLPLFLRLLARAATPATQDRRRRPPQPAGVPGHAR